MPSPGAEEGSGQELSLEVRPEAGIPAVRIGCFIPAKPGR